MKKILSVMVIIIVFVLGIYTNVLATDRLVDIPVPPDNHGMADFTEEEAAELEKQYEENNINAEAQGGTATENTNAQENETNNSTNEIENGYVAKSANNYLKSLSIEGYELEPEFVRENDAYTIYVKDRNSLTSLNIVAEADDEKATIEGAGKIEVAPEQDVATIQVKAENGDTRVYTIKIEDEKNKEDGASINSDVIVGIVLVIIIILIAIFTAISKKKSGKKVE